MTNTVTNKNQFTNPHEIVVPVISVYFQRVYMETNLNTTLYWTERNVLFLTKLKITQVSDPSQALESHLNKMRCNKLQARETDRCPFSQNDKNEKQKIK